MREGLKKAIDRSNDHRTPPSRRTCPAPLPMMCSTSSFISTMPTRLRRRSVRSSQKDIDADIAPVPGAWARLRLARGTRRQRRVRAGGCTVAAAPRLPQCRSGRVRSTLSSTVCAPIDASADSLLGTNATSPHSLAPAERGTPPRRRRSMRHAHHARTTQPHSTMRYLHCVELMH